MSDTMNAIAEIHAERLRQISREGWSAAHDDSHTNCELARAAACYATGNRAGWPWDEKWWKPTTVRHDLIKAAALIVAEIERLDRQSGEDRHE